MTQAHVTGLGVWFPETVRTNDAWPTDFAGRSGDRTLVDIPVADDEAGRISAHYLAQEARDPFIGAVERRVAPDSMHAWEAQVAAGSAALRDAGLAARELDYVIAWDIVPDRVGPAGVACATHYLGAHRAIAFPLDAACASSIPQLMLACSLVEAGRARHVLLIQTHLLTRAFPMGHPASPGIGDGASALVVSAEPRWPIRAVHGLTHPEFSDAVVWCRGKDDTTDIPWWKPGPDFYIGSRRPAAAKQLMQDTVAYGAQTVRELMREANCDIERIRLLASVHPRGWVPGAIAQCLGLPHDVAECTYERYAHLGGCGPVVNWWSAREKGLMRSGGLIALYAQGAGFMRGAALIEVPPGS